MGAEVQVAEWVCMIKLVTGHQRQGGQNTVWAMQDGDRAEKRDETGGTKTHANWDATLSSICNRAIHLDYLRTPYIVAAGKIVICYIVGHASVTLHYLIL